MTEELDLQESENPVEEQPTSEVETTEEVVEEVNEELTKAQELARNQKIRAEKAEKELKRLKALGLNKAEEPAPKSDGMSLKDIRALQDVHDEDVDDVINYAKFKGISIAEAKKDLVISSMLKTKDELRKTAEATNTGKAKRGSSNLSSEQIYEAGMSGKEVDPVKFAEAMMDLRKRKVLQ